MSETSRSNPNKPSLFRRVLVFGLMGSLSTTACGLPRAEYDASKETLETCNTGTPLYQKSRPLDDIDTIVPDNTAKIAELHQRAMNAGGEVTIHTTEEDREIDPNTHFYSLSADQDELVLGIGQQDNGTMDKVVFPFESDKPKEITLGALACSDDKIYEKQIVYYLEAALDSTEALDPTPN